MKKRVLLGIVAFVFLILLSPVPAVDICSESGPFDSPDYSLRVTDFVVSAAITPVVREEKIFVEFNMTNTGDQNISFRTDGISARTLAPNEISRLIGTVFGEPSPPLAPGQTASVDGNMALNQEGTWRIWPYYYVKEVGENYSEGPYAPSDYWQVCDLNVLFAPDNTPPEVHASYWPEDPIEGGFVTINAWATDNIELDYINILVDAELAETCYDSPCVHRMNDLASTTFGYAATAYDTSGNSTTTGYTYVKVLEADELPPEIEINHDPFTVELGDRVTFTATALDASGIEKIEIYARGQKVHECNNESTCVYVNEGTFEHGLVVYYAKAYDTVGNSATSETKNFSVFPLDRQSPTVQIIVSDDNPTAIKQVTFTATAQDERGIGRIDIFIDGQLAHTCDQNPPIDQCNYVDGPYGDYVGGSQTVSYYAIAYDIFNNTNSTQRQSLFVGRRNNLCQPLLVSDSEHWKKIDIVFAPDSDYGGNMQQFVQDLESMIQNAFWASPPILANRDKFNFYYFKEDGNASRMMINGAWSCSPIAPPTDIATECGFEPESVAIIHINDCRDSASLEPPMYTTEPDSFRTMIHEAGHALFGLADEYCCDSVYFYPDPLPNIWSTRAGCRNYATEQGWNRNDCEHIGPEYPDRAACQAGAGRDWSGLAALCTSDNGVWTGQPIWRLDQSPDIMRNGGNAVHPFQRADILRVNYIFDIYYELEAIDDVIDAIQEAIDGAWW